MPTGWRPYDVEKNYPLFTIHRMNELKKYYPTYSNRFTAFSVVYLSVIFALLCFLFFRFGEISNADALINGLILMAVIFGFTSLLDKKLYGLISLLAVSLAIAAFCTLKGDWFGLNTFMPMGSLLVAAYFIATASMAGWFYKNELSAT